MRLGIVVPCCNEEELHLETARRLLRIRDHLEAEPLAERGSLIYFVDDGSKHKTGCPIEGLSKSDTRVCGIKRSRNRGHQNALRAGLLTAEGEALVSIDADLQSVIMGEEQYMASSRIPDLGATERSPIMSCANKESYIVR